jgi:hypothetical protein
MKCGATTKSGKPCQAQAMENGRCRIHGGLTPSGFALPQFKTGRYSKVLPEALRHRYEVARDDEDLLSLRDEIALIDLRITDLLGKPPTDETWAQALFLIEQRRKLAESEHKRLATLKQYVSVEQVYAFIGALGGILREHVADRRALAAIQRDLSGLLARPARIIAHDGDDD